MDRIDRVYKENDKLIAIHLGHWPPVLSHSASAVADTLLSALTELGRKRDVLKEHLAEHWIAVVLARIDRVAESAVTAKERAELAAHSNCRV